MTNYEYYKEQIERITRLGLMFGFNTKTGEVAYCNNIDCADCKFYGACGYKKLKWADEEYVEPAVDWSKVPIDTKVLVSDDGVTWQKRHFAGVKLGGKPTVYIHGMTSWSAGDTTGWVKYKYTKLAEEE